MSPDNDIERREKPSLYGVAGALLLSIITLTLLEDGIVLVSSFPMISTTFAQKENNIDNTAKVTSTTTNTSLVSSLHGIQLSALPIWKEQATNTGVTPINKTHTKITFIGNGTLTLPDTGKTIVVTNNGT
jgi:hypothetical protein